MFRCQVGPNVAIDGLIDEQGPVLAKPQSFKPFADVHTFHELQVPKRCSGSRGILPGVIRVAWVGLLCVFRVIDCTTEKPASSGSTVGFARSARSTDQD